MVLSFASLNKYVVDSNATKGLSTWLLSNNFFKNCPITDLGTWHLREKYTVRGVVSYKSNQKENNKSNFLDTKKQKPTYL